MYSQLVKYRFFTLFLRKEQSGKRVSDKTAKWQKAGKERLQIATHSLYSLDSSSGGLETELKITGKISGENTNIDY